MLHNRQGAGYVQVGSYFPLTGWIAAHVRERGDELQHLSLARGKIISGFEFMVSHMTTYTRLMPIRQEQELFNSYPTQPIDMEMIKKNGNF
jgi:hypothetical protein